MLYRVLDLRFSRRLGGIDDEPLQRLLHGHELVARTERLYHHDGLPHLLVSVLYRLATLPEPARQVEAGHAAPPPAPTVSPPKKERHRKEGKSDWRALLEEKDAPLFESLRAWRTERARSEAVPPYIVLTNVQLARVAGERPRSLAGLKKIPGFGESRLKRFGEDLLKMVAEGVIGNGRDISQSAGTEDAPSSGDGVTRHGADSADDNTDDVEAEGALDAEAPP